MACVAPRTGAWIETTLREKSAGKSMSPLAQGRGLKLLLLQEGPMQARSRPSHRGVD